MENFDGIDMDAAGRVAGQGFYYLMGDIARLHSAILSYARDFMIDRGFTYVIPPYMIRSNVVTGVMSFEEMDSMMYKIEVYVYGNLSSSKMLSINLPIIECSEVPIKYKSSPSILSYARDFMIDRGFTYVIPPYMIRSNVVTGVMSFEEMDSMMYKIEVYVYGNLSSSKMLSINLPIIECSEVPIKYKSSPSILYIMLSMF